MMRNKAYIYNKERRRRYIAGFTMAELLIVVAIIGVLAGVSFIAVQSHQRSMTQLQYDTIAKEIFVAAQNHLTLAKSENYGQVSDLSKKLDLQIGGKDFFGADGNAPADGTTADIRYFYSGDDNTSTAFDQILPFGAIELVTGGKFIIRYQPIAARVLDVFYWTTGNSNYDAELNGSNYSTLVGTKESASDRHRNFSGRGLLGWCGGEGIVETGVYLKAPEIVVKNEDILSVIVTDNNIVKATDGNADMVNTLKPQLKLLITGSSSGAKVAIPLNSSIATTIKNGDRVEYNSGNGQYTVVLDDITTSNLHFSELTKISAKMPTGTLDNNKTFIPGENITIQAVAYSNDALTSVAYSGEWTTNSLFGEVTENATTLGSVITTTAGTVKISNIRHLANLNDNLSDVGYSDNYFGYAISAVQTVDLDWTTFKDGVKAFKKAADDSSVCLYDKNNTPTKADCFLPVSVTNSYALIYNGQSDVIISETADTGGIATTTQKTIQENHRIKGIVVEIDDANANGGVFGALTNGQIKNLALIDISVNLTKSGNAGALAGELTGTAVENVVAYHTSGNESKKITTASGSAGGLIGAIAGATSVTKSAAALIVESKAGDAGGLIGTSTSTGTISSSYSGGHTEKGEYSDSEYNVTATGNAGGLIGNAGSTEITGCYSTCSVTGATAGGFVGTAGGTLTSCYCTGLVGSTDKKGAFAGTLSTGGSTSGCSYFEIINEQLDKEDYPYLWALGNALDDDTSVIPFDKSADTYNLFVGTSASWREATVYDDDGRSYYTMEKTRTDGTTETVKMYYLGTSVFNAGTDFVATHYGDWPAPEIFVVNTANSGS